MSSFLPIKKEYEQMQNYSWGQIVKERYSAWISDSNNDYFRKYKTRVQNNLGFKLEKLEQSTNQILHSLTPNPNTRHSESIKEKNNLNAMVCRWVYKVENC